MRGKHATFLETAMGPFGIWGDDEAIIGAGITREMGEDTPDLPPHMLEARRQAGEYFGGARRTFDLPLRTEGTPFQKEVWAEMCRIPFGETRSYGQVAKAIGRPGGARAVGQACRSNPIGVIQPCHRVIGHDGQLVGFGGQTKDLSLKQRLIAHEVQASTRTLDGL